MKITTWQLKKVTEPKTLADVRSSQGRPVLCWYNAIEVRQMYVDNERATRSVSKHGDTSPLPLYQPHNWFLYDQPVVPTKLEDVPDRRVIVTVDPDGVSDFWFREQSQWWYSPGGLHPFTDDHLISPDWDKWQLTDHCVELVETEIGVME